MNKSNSNSPDPFETRETTHAFFQGLERLVKTCGKKTNKNEQARVVITACIDAGLVNGTRIVGVLEKLGFDRRHAGKTLASLLGPDPDRHDWYKDEAGHYRLHLSLAQQAAASLAA